MMGTWGSRQLPDVSPPLTWESLWPLLGSELMLTTHLTCWDSRSLAKPSELAFALRRVLAGTAPLDPAGEQQAPGDVSSLNVPFSLSAFCPLCLHVACLPMCVTSLSQMCFPFARNQIPCCFWRTFSELLSHDLSLRHIGWQLVSLTLQLLTTNCKPPSGRLFFGSLQCSLPKITGYSVTSHK